MTIVEVYICGCFCWAGGSARRVVFEPVEAASSEVVGFVIVTVMLCLLMFIVVLDIRMLRKSARPRCCR